MVWALERGEDISSYSDCHFLRGDLHCEVPMEKLVRCFSSTKKLRFLEERGIGYLQNGFLQSPRSPSPADAAIWV